MIKTIFNELIFYIALVSLLGVVTIPYTMYVVWETISERSIISIAEAYTECG